MGKEYRVIDVLLLALALRVAKTETEVFIEEDELIPVDNPKVKELAAYVVNRINDHTNTDDRVTEPLLSITDKDLNTIEPQPSILSDQSIFQNKDLTSNDEQQPSTSRIFSLERRRKGNKQTQKGKGKEKSTKKNNKKKSKDSSSEDEEDVRCFYCSHLFSETIEGEIQCPACSLWAHCSCAGVEDDDEDITLVCERCAVE
ncbi:unnamed protein product [Euphydryas editha]|uniref:Zinc finger PHD-type domain-containing protein n=1 Tax=Euphydryas editha TaxID=104508 RepID=A0AAU9TS99_EUPED|nr:unnamed protein product [Euphydryas editha]